MSYSVCITATSDLYSFAIFSILHLNFRLIIKSKIPLTGERFTSPTNLRLFKLIFNLSVSSKKRIIQFSKYLNPVRFYPDNNL